MKKFQAIPAILALTASAMLPSCDDETNVGSSITPGEVTIVVDSAFTVTGRSVRAASVDSRDGNLLIGRLSVEDFGDLSADFVGRLMPASVLSIPDSIPLDDVSGMTLRFTFDKEGFTGDTLAPQQLSVYALTRQLPDGIDNTFDPDGYYNPASPLGTASYTASSLGLGTKNTSSGMVDVPLSADFARQVVRQYRTDPSVFQWPESFASYFPGIYVRSTFGRGLVLNFTNTEFLTYWHRTEQVRKVVDGVSVMRDTVMRDSTSLFAISPEVLSANLLRLDPAQSVTDRIARGQLILQSPAGYNVELEFPAQSILDRYLSDNFNMGVINTLTFTLPVTTPANDYGIAPPPYLLMVKTSKLKEFFAQKMVPQTDDTDAFWAAYDSEKGQYEFKSMRPYIMALMKEGGIVKEEDMQFTLVPVGITTETVGYTGSQRVVVTSCLPYIAHPSLCVIDMDRAKVKFTYSRQVIR